MLALLTASPIWAVPVRAPLDVRYVMRAWYAQNEVCRGGQGPTSDAACHDRAFSQALLRQLGWTTGAHDGEWRRLPGQPAVRLRGQ